MMWGRKTEPKDSYAIIDRAIDGGINFLDTANVYSRGRSEEITGEALKKNGKRHLIVLATKVHGRMDDDDVTAEGSSRRHIIQQCEASLKRLQTDYIDLYQIHRPRSDTPIDETLRALDDLIRAGKVRYIGTSTFGAWQAVEAYWIAKEFGLNRFVCEQPPYNILDRRIERDLLPMARQYGYGIIPWSPLAGGLLTGKYTRENQDPADSRFSGEINPRQRARKTDQVWDVVEALQPLAKKKGCTMAQYALAWVTAQPDVTSPIIGPRTMEQLEDNLGSLDVEINAQDQAAVDGIVSPGGMAAPFYDADFAADQWR
jgi:aryl-alcohol dehydrogenase-like predicted oxidoreductase